MVEQIFKRGPKEVDDEDVVKAFLAEIVDIRYAGWNWLATLDLSALVFTYGIRRVFCRFGTRLSVGVHRSSLVPVAT